VCQVSIASVHASPTLPLIRPDFDDQFLTAAGAMAVDLKAEPAAAGDTLIETLNAPRGWLGSPGRM